MANAVERGSNSNGYEAGGGGGVRPPRLPRWTRQEILVLIQGKRVVEGRGRGRAGSNRAGSIGPGSSPVEPKWAAVAAYCRRHGVNRGPVQCRKRWSNLAGDYKKIKEWEKGKEAKESFWVMRNDLRRERRLPGFFDREVYDILDGVVEVEVEVEEVEEKGKRKEEEEEEVVFDSGRGAGDDGLFSDFDEEEKGSGAAVVVEEEEEEAGEEEERVLPPPPPLPVAVVPLSEKKFQPSQQENSEPGTSKDKQPAYNLEKDSPSQEGQKRRRTSQEGVGETELQSQLIEVLERNSRMLTAQLEAQNMNCQLDRDQRKEQANSLLGVLSKLADALGRIADKL
ncbi:trihelix transcription factor ASR3 [Typha angustifolia]|uniref:trihelix transcription factor ASR3 n=1 Tax=Typha angustifolia TaxID=59011 RepID=UPI003C2EB904